MHWVKPFYRIWRYATCITARRIKEKKPADNMHSYKIKGVIKIQYELK